MDEDKFEKIDELTFYLDLKINVLYNALKNFDERCLSWVSVNYAFEDIYKLSQKVREIMGA